MKAPVIEIEGLDVKLGANPTIRQLNLRVQEGETLCLIGKNGSGKSTLLKTLTALVPIENGVVQVLGRRVDALGKKELRVLRSQVGQVFQGLHLVARLNVLQNVLIGRLSHQSTYPLKANSLFRKFAAADIEIAKDALKSVQMSHKMNARTDSLSGGEMRKVAIAMALAQESKLLICDEPTGSLDPQAAMQITALLSRLVRDNHLTMITVVHSLQLLKELGGRVIGMRAGEVILDKNQSEISEKELESLYV